MRYSPFVILSGAKNLARMRVSHIRAGSLALLGMTLTILTAFFIPAPTAQASSHLAPFCFTEAECTGAPYFGQLSDFEPSECKVQGKLYQEAGFTHFCYSKPKAPLFPYKLQVPFLSFAFKGTVKGVEDYIAALYTLLISLAGVVAGIMIVWAGVKWLTAAGSPDRISDARHKIGNALIGLILVLSSYLILQTINPDLVRLRLPAVKLVRQLQIASETCINRPEYPCGGIPLKQEGGKWVADTSKPIFEGGKYPCTCTTAQCPGGKPQKEYNANPPCPSGTTGGDCVAQYCPFPGCHQPNIKKVDVNVTKKVFGPAPAGGAGGSGQFGPGGTGPAPASTTATQLIFNRRGCYNPQLCQNCANLNLVSADGSVNLEAMANCTISPCKCLVVLEDEKPICTKGKSAGQPCGTNEVCESGNCNFAFGNTCAPTPSGKECEDDADCESKICNTVDEGITGVLPRFNGICRDKQSLKAGDDCDRSALCKEGLTCRNGVSGLVVFGGPGTGPGPGARILKIAAECKP